MASSPFKTPPEVPAYFEAKNLKPAFSWQDVWGEEHAHSFTVAKATDAELLTVFKSSIQRALEAGESFETWRGKLIPELQRTGWYGKRIVEDPTGSLPAKAVDFSRPRRLQTIFWSNVRAARAAGQWERVQRTKKGLPFLLYVRSTAERKRPEHLRWVGIILPVDDPFWATHFPPNGWLCKCAVRQITVREADTYRDRDDYLFDAPPIETRPFLNSRTGEVAQVPVGIDPGWGGNPGLARARSLTENLQGRLDQAGPAIARRAIGELLASPTPRVLLDLPFETKLPVAVSERAAALSDAASPVVMMPSGTIRTKILKHASVTADELPLIQQVLDEGRAIDEARRDTLTFVAEIDARWWEVVIRKSAAGFLRVATFHATDGRKVRSLLRRFGEAVATTKPKE